MSEINMSNDIYESFSMMTTFLKIVEILMTWRINGKSSMKLAATIYVVQSGNKQFESHLWRGVQHYVIKVCQTCGRLVVFSGDTSFFHQYNWPPRYSWNIVESGIPPWNQPTKVINSHEPINIYTLHVRPLNHE